MIEKRQTAPLLSGAMAGTSLADNARVGHTLASFIRALRMAEVRVSTAETLDAFRAVALIGMHDRRLLKDSLAVVLPKTQDEKAAFDRTFDKFFTFDTLAFERQSAQPKQSQAITTEPAGRASPEAIQPAEPDHAHQMTVVSAVPAPINLPLPGSALGRLLMANDQVALSQNLAAAAQSEQIERIEVFTQQGLYSRRIMEAMGQNELSREIWQLAESEVRQDLQLAEALNIGLERLREQVQDYVRQQFLLHADTTGRQLREQLLRKVRLSNLEQRTFVQVQDLVLRMARRLASKHAHRRRRLARRGQLHVPATFRHNLGFGGPFFNLKWRSKRVTHPEIFALCDVSGSMTNYARFMLMLLYALEQVLPKVRAFAFSSGLKEVTELFRLYNLGDAIDKTLWICAGGATDYGQTLMDFQRMCLADISHRSTVIILGDGRNNYGNPRNDLLKKLHDRAGRILWLNPEPRYSWFTGDSEMRRYSPFCHQVEVCNNLAQLERFVSRLLQVST